MSWLSAILAAIVGAVKGWFGKKAEPTVTDLAAQNAATQTRLDQQEKNNEVLSDAARARLDADATVVQQVHPDSPDVNTDANNRIADKFPGLFRD